MSYFLNRFLNNSRMRLNQIIVGIHLAKTTGWVSAGGALVVLAARVCGWASSGAFRVWLSITLIGVTAGLIMGWRRRLNIPAAARWLDEYQKNAEAYSAALVCLERNCSEPLDELVLERAETMATNPYSIDWPTGYLFRKSFIAGGLLLASLATVLWNPPPALNLSQYIVPGKTVETVPVNSKRPDIDRLPEQQMAKEWAEYLFPKDVKRAGEFQRALESGNAGQLEELLRQARQQPEARKIQAPSLAGQEHLLDKERQLVFSKTHSLIDRLKNRDRNGLIQGESNPAGQDEPGRLASRKNKTEHGLKPDTGKGSKKRIAGTNPDRNRSFFRYIWKNNNSGANNENTQNGELYKGGRAPGQEPGNKQGNWSIAAKSGSGKIVQKKQETPEIEYVLPGKNATVPLARILPDFRRTAEAALSRNGVPSEYDDFVRNYFLELSREIKGSSPESEGK